MSTRSDCGYSLPELICALGLSLGILGSSASVVNEALTSWRLRTAANQLSFSFVAARSKAALGGLRVAVVFDEYSGRYSQVADPPENKLEPITTLPNGISFVCPDSDHAVTLSPPESDESAAVFGPSGRLLGASGATGHACLGNQRTGDYKRLEISRVGRVTVKSWTEHGWKKR